MREVRFRPSLRTRVINGYRGLSKEKSEQFLYAINNDVSPDSISDTEVLDLATLGLQYRVQVEGKDFNPTDKARLDKYLSYRSTLKVKSQLPALASTTEAKESDSRMRPDYAHGPLRIGIGLGQMQQSKTFQEFELKFAYHDLLNDDLGFPLFSHIDFPGIKLRYWQQKEMLTIESVKFVAITSLFPLSPFEKRLSWAVDFQWLNPKDLGCETCGALHFSAGPGVTLPLLTDRWVIYWLASAYLEGSESFKKWLRYGPKLEVATVLSLSHGLKFQSSFAFLSDLFQDYRQSYFYESKAGLAWAPKTDWELRVEGVRIWPSEKTSPQNDEVRLGLNKYF